MAKKNYPSIKRKITTKPKNAVSDSRTVRTVRTEVRNSAVPRVTKSAPKKEITAEMIAVRAYEIFASGQGGSETDNWLRAERELRGA